MDFGLLKSKSHEISENQKNNLSKKLIESPFKIFSILKQQKMKETTEDNDEINPIDDLITKLAHDLKDLKITHHYDEKYIDKLFQEKEKQCVIDQKKITLVEVIHHALKKNKKNENDILILKLFFMHMEKFMSLLFPLKVNLNDLFTKLVLKMKCDKKNKDVILFRAGDIGQKLYILLDGHIGILIKKEKIIVCTPFEFIKYLIVLHLYQEHYLMTEIIAKNKNVINIEEETIVNLLQVFEIYNFQKQNKRLKEDYKSIFEFAQNDYKFIKFFENKYNFSPMIALDILSFSRKGVEQLYEFYSRKIMQINKNLKLGLRGSDLFASFIKRQMNNTGIIKPTSQQELLSFLKPYDKGEKTFKNDEEYFQKILSVNEISSEKINKTSVENYIKNLEPENILNDIRVDEDSIKFTMHEKDRVVQDGMNIKTYEFYEINQLYDGSIFGELALSNPNSKRTATIITKAESYFGTIVKQYYDLSFKSAQEKSQSRNIAFFLKSPIFKGINQGIFLNKFYYLFKKKGFKNGDILYKKGKERKSISFIIKGELEIKAAMTLNEMTDLINIFGGVLNDKYMIDLLNSYEELKRYYINKKHNIKLCVLKDKEIIGLDDMTLNNIYIFNCSCSSANKTEVYELEYIYIKEAKKYEKIVENINSFVNQKRNLFIKILIEQRNTIIANEMCKIRKIHKHLNGPNKSISMTARNNKNFINTSRDNISNNQMIWSYRQKQKGENNSNFDKKKLKNPIKFEKDKNSKKYLINSIDKDKKLIKIEEDIDQILTSFNYNNVDKKFTYNIKIRKKTYNREKNKTENLEIEKSKKTKNNFVVKKSDILRNKIILDKIKSTNSNFKLEKCIIKPLINDICNYRTRKNIIPNPINLKSKKKKNLLSPFILKEYERQFTERRNKIYLNNFYIDSQKIFDTLLSLDKKDNKENQKIQKAPDSIRRRIKVSNLKNNIFTSLKEKENINNFNHENDKIPEINHKDFSEFSKTQRNYQKIKNKGIFIDILCLDNWEEKENFTKRFLSENNKKRLTGN